MIDFAYVHMRVYMCVCMRVCVCVCVCAPFLEVDKVVRLSLDLVLVPILDEDDPGHVHACSEEGLTDDHVASPSLPTSIPSLPPSLYMHTCRHCDQAMYTCSAPPLTQEGNTGRIYRSQLLLVVLESVIAGGNLFHVLKDLLTL